MADMETYREIAIDFPKECQSLKEQAHGFAEEVVRPAATAVDRMADAKQAITPASPLWSALKAAYAHSFHTAAISRQMGGLGLSGLGMHVLLEELGWGSAGFAVSLIASALPFMALARDGRSELVDAFVRPFAADEAGSWIGCLALSEPLHGSDAFAIGSEEFRHPSGRGQLVARREAEHYVIDGEKAAWISNGSIATHALCSVTIEPSKRMSARGLALVPLNAAGVSRSEPLNKLGQRALNQGGISFEQVRIPSSLMLRGGGYEPDLEWIFSFLNSATAAVLTGLARAAFEEALTYSKQRVQGGKAISEHQLVQRHLFDMFTKVEACRALSRATLLYERGSVGGPSLEHAIGAKTFCAQAALEVANDAMQVFGGYGISTGQLSEKLFRDARVALVEHGIKDVLSLVGARRILQR
jgi:alkylation response protein AidB-like acyl-CoA dehydrogenase